VPQVDVIINGRQFRMSCEDGEEARLKSLAEDLDQRISRLRTRFGEIGDTRLTIMAALAVADELTETKQRMAQIEPELASLKEARIASSDSAQATQEAIAAALNAAAERIEGITKRLNETRDDTDVPMG
jgi:cell division protein ZapA